MGHLQNIESLDNEECIPYRGWNLKIQGTLLQHSSYGTPKQNISESKPVILVRRQKVAKDEKVCPHKHGLDAVPPDGVLCAVVQWTNTGGTASQGIVCRILPPPVFGSRFAEILIVYWILSILCTPKCRISSDFTVWTSEGRSERVGCDTVFAVGSVSDPYIYRPESCPAVLS